MHTDRRTFLRRAGLGTVATTAVLAGRPRPSAAADEDLAPFFHGVASGDPLPTSVILWTRVTVPDGGPVTVRWLVARDVGLTDLVRTGEVVTDAGRDHTVKVDPGGLEPGAWYFFAFEALGGRSIIGRTKTAPDGPVDRLRFGVASCANYQGGFFNAYARLAERDDLDAVIHLGDYLYEYGNGDDRYAPGSGELAAARDHDPAHEMVQLGDYRRRHAWYKLDPDLRRLHQLLPFVVTWDDHESTNNSHRDGAQNHDPVTEGAWATRKAAAQQAYAEWMPIRVSDPARIYRTLRYGLADVIVLDTRLDDRDPELGSVGATIVNGQELDDPDRRMISDAQRQMLFDGLASSSATWKVVAQQVIVGQWNAGGAPRLPARQDLPRFVLKDGGNALNPDQWDGYPAERDRLFGHIAGNGIDNVVVLTGDVHTSWAIDLTPDPYNPTVYNPITGEGALGVEFVAPSVTSANFEALGPAGLAAFEAVTLADNPHVKYVDFDAHGYVVLDLTPERAQADWYVVDTVLEPSDAEFHAASWTVAEGRPGVHAADGPATTGARAPATPAGDPPPALAIRAGSIPASLSVMVGSAALAKVVERRSRVGGGR